MSRNDYNKSENDFERDSRLIAIEADTSWIPIYSSLALTETPNYDVIS